MELLTETSTQIRVSEKLPFAWEGQHQIIAGTCDFGKCLLRREFHDSN
jgi:hypothetical protein